MVIEVLTRSSGRSAKRVGHVLECVDRDADLADLAFSDRVIGVIAHLSRQVERYGEASRTALEQIAVAGVRLLGAGVAAYCRMVQSRPR